MATDIMNDLTNTLLNKYADSFKIGDSFNKIKDDIVNGMKEALGTNKMTNDGYFYKSNTKESQQQRSNYNDIIKNFNDEENLLKKQFALKKSHEAELAALKAKYHVASSTQEEQLAKKTLNDYKKLYEYQFDEKRKYYKQLDEEESNIYKNSLETGKKLTDDQLAQLKIINDKRKEYRDEEEREEKEKNRRKQLEADKFINQLKDKVKNIDWKKIITDTLNFGIDTYLSNQIKAGLTKYTSAYEQNFTSIAGTTGYANRQQTHELITGVIEEVNSESYLKHGLNFNTDVFPEIVNATKQGFLGDEAQEVAISNAIDKKIMPWLDTSSDTWVQLQYTVSDNMLQSIKGQQIQLQATREGNRILQNGVVSALLDNLAPTLQAIDANTVSEDAMGSAYQAVETLMERGLDKTSAVKFVRDAISADQHTYKALSSNDPGKILMGIGSMTGEGGISGAINYYSNTVGNVLAGTAGNKIATGAIDSIFGNYLPADYSNFASIFKDLNISYNKYSDQGNLYNDKTNKLTNYVTATQSYDNTIENTMTNVIKDAVNVPHLTDVMEQGLIQLKEIRKILISMLVTAGAAFIQGLPEAIKAGTNASGAGAGLLEGGLVGGLTQGGSSLVKGLSGGKALALGSIFTTGGLLAAGYGAKEAYNEFSQAGKATNTDKETKDHINSGLLAGVGTVGGGMMAAAGLGLASGPVGWAGLAVAGVGLLGKTIYDTVTKIGSAGAAIEEEYAQQKESIRQSTQSNVDNLTDILGVLQKTTATEEEIQEQKNKLMSSGLLTESDLLIAKDANKDQLEELTKAYLKSTNEFSGEIQTALDSYTAESKAWSQDAWAGMENVLQQYNDNDNGKSRNDEGYIEAASMIMNTIYSDLEKQKQNGVKLDKSSQHIYDAISKSMSGGYTPEELNSIIDSGWFNEHLQSMQISSPEVIDRIQTQMSILDSDAARNIVIGMRNGNQYYDPTETANALTYLINAKNSTTKENALEYLDEFKKAGYKLSNYKNEKHHLETKWGNDINLNQYKLGSSYIPYDMIAQLHAGERVLTANQNKEYTQELQTGNGSIIVNSIQDVVSAIQNQTKTIIDYLSTMNFNNSSGFKKLSMLPSMGNTKITL